ncbi:hypothetical protein ACQPZ2_36960 [Nocardia pseudovaccinii]|uniref:hypothetical protein n=1 Tax=Nocardia pseudovaccinii TaxID=189540 RepID=UPI003D8A017F
MAEIAALVLIGTFVGLTADANQKPLPRLTDTTAVRVRRRLSEPASAIRARRTSPRRRWIRIVEVGCLAVGATPADALDWTSGTRLTIRCYYDGILLVHHTDLGTAHVTSAYFRIPFRQRRQAHLDIGDKVLLVAHPDQQQLAIYPPPMLNALFGNYLRSLES